MSMPRRRPVVVTGLGAISPFGAGVKTFWQGISAGACAQYHANAPLSYFKTISLWKTPIAACGNGQNNCLPYSQWQQAWTTEVTG